MLRAAGMRGFGAMMRSYQVVPEPLLQKVGIPIAALEDDELRISLNAYAELLEMAAELIDCPDIGLLMAERQDISILGPIAIAMQNAATVGEGFGVCSQFLHTHSPGIRLSIHPDRPDPGITSLRISLVVPKGMRTVQLMDQCLADLHHFIAWMAQERPPVLAVHLPHKPAATKARYQRVFEFSPAFKQDHAQLQIPSDFLDHSLEGASEAIHQLSVEYLQLRYEPGNQTMSERVENVLSKALSSTRGRRDIVANLLNVHPRTLQRRLSAEGTSYQTILDGIRKAESRRWLTQTATPLSHIPGLVGLADQAVLTRSCQKWFGTTPAKIRQGQLRQP